VAGLRDHRYSIDFAAGKRAELDIVIARDVQHLRTRARELQEARQYLQMSIRKHCPCFHAFEIDDVAIQVDPVGRHLVQEVQQIPGSRRARTKMNIG
jgi:hypothetical protein